MYPHVKQFETGEQRKWERVERRLERAEARRRRPRPALVCRVRATTST